MVDIAESGQSGSIFLRQRSQAAFVISLDSEHCVKK